MSVHASIVEGRQPRPVFPTDSLADSHAEEMAIDADARNDVADSDPLDLYGQLAERDLAASVLVESIPAGLTCGLSRSERIIRDRIAPLAWVVEWRAFAFLDDVAKPEPRQLAAEAATPTEAVRKLVDAYNAHAAAEAAAAKPADGETWIKAVVDRQSGRPSGFVGYARLSPDERFAAAGRERGTREQAQADADRTLAVLRGERDAVDAIRATGTLGTVAPELAADWLEFLDGRGGGFASVVEVDTAGRVALLDRTLDQVSLDHVRGSLDLFHRINATTPAVVA